jgi:hypothetical protein
MRLLCHLLKERWRWICVVAGEDAKKRFVALRLALMAIEAVLVKVGQLPGLLKSSAGRDDNSTVYAAMWAKKDQDSFAVDFRKT